jgi:hypothetical protein
MLDGSKAHIYRQKPWILALNLFNLLIFGILAGSFLITAVFSVAMFFRAGNGLEIIAIVFVCLFIPILILLGLNFIIIMISVITSFYSYIKISPDCIEQKTTPYLHIRCNWADVDRLGKTLWIFDVIYLNSYEVLGFSLSLKPPFNYLLSKQCYISLASYTGWPDGQLARDLRLYAPKLFENK